MKVEAYWPKIFAKALQGKDVSSFFNFGGAASGPAAPAAPAAQKAADKPKKEDKKKEAPPPPPKEEEEEMDMGDLFGWLFIRRITRFNSVLSLSTSHHIPHHSKLSFSLEYSIISFVSVYFRKMWVGILDSQLN